MTVGDTPGLHPRPTGWYAIGFSSDLRPGRVQSRVLFGERFAVFRSEAGVPAVIHSVCPHLGADLSRGRVCGERLVCPFHRFEYDRDGVCVATPYVGREPPKARTRHLPVRERDGVITVWWDEHGRAPTWEPEAPELHGWTTPRGRLFELQGHPLSTSENSVDIGHFSTLHGFDRVEVVAPVRTHGPYLTGSYEFGHRIAGVFVRNTFTVHLWGLGYSFVENRTHGLELRTRLWIFATPTEPGRIELRIATAAPTGEASRVGKLVGKLLQELALRSLSRDVAADFDVWTHRTHLDRPALAPGDGPVGQYRRWAQQFDPRQLDEQVAVRIVS
jgi:phenylpropionate dioxygenase-like ring-hydroxylating dioxygenase large terminal subunit